LSRYFSLYHAAAVGETPWGEYRTGGRGERAALLGVRPPWQRYRFAREGRGGSRIRR
jgi:hypothetical protein